ncbi:TrkA family potassium uptake protein [uncultured Tessaracoccus sp.]|uniref:potassium channel family protein n=1 Tax=uncultured Tessaracoccus sp. TaxID=905023 RepID=UPI0026382AD7|nr:TrkA family potassium uptake protein [uncultured Tessaracoccus sp.]
MHIVIMGCGRTGAMLARGLEKRGHSLAVIDVEEEAFGRLGSQFKGQTVKGVGFDRQVLETAGIRNAGGFAAVSSGDNSNILAARVVKEIYHVENVVARIYDQGRAQVYERLGIPTVAPVRWSTGMVMRRLLPEGSEPVWRDPSGQVRMLQVHVHPGWVNRRISDLADAAGCIIPVITRLGTGIVPTAQTVFQDGDLVFACCEVEQTSTMEMVLGNPPKGATR